MGTLLSLSLAALLACGPRLPPEGTFAGVVQGPDGARLRDARLDLNALEGEPLTYAYTDRRGRFSGDLPDGPFALTVSHPDGTAAFWSQDQVGEPGPWRIALQTVEDGRRLHGTIAGGPSVVEAWRHSDDEGDVFRAEIAADGTYAFVLPEGRYTLRVPNAITFPTTVSLEGPATRQDVTATTTTPTSREVLDALRPAIVPLDSDLLHPIPGEAGLELFAGARIVGLGESTHGTAEFSQVKHGLFRQLVEQGRTTTLAMEANVLGAEAVEAWLHGDGSLDDAMGGLFLLWRTEEVRDLLLWMREYNAAASADAQLHFRGYDVQDIRGPRQLLLAYLTDVRPAWRGLLEPVEKLEDLRGSATDADRAEATRAVATIQERLQSERGELVHATSAADYDRAVRGVELLGMGLPVVAPESGPTYFEARDRGMADNVEKIARELPEGELLVVWAHNGHIAHDSAGLLGTSMGTRLERSMGDQYVSVALHTRRGEYTASVSADQPRTTVAVPIDASASGFFAEGFAALGPAFVLDLRAVEEPGQTWLAGPRWHHSTGWLAPSGPDPGVPVALAGRFDAVLFLDETHGAARL